MLLRIRWFVMGVLASLGLVSYLMNQVRRARERLTARSLTNTGLRGVARLLDSAADGLQPKMENRR